MDETYVGGFGKPGVTGRGAAGKTVVAGAIERVGRGFGRARLEVISNASSASLAAFLRTHASPGSTVITDAWPAYPAAFRAAWIGSVVASRCPNAVRCADPFQVVKWATDALNLRPRAPAPYRSRICATRISDLPELAPMPFT